MERSGSAGTLLRPPATASATRTTVTALAVPLGLAAVSWVVTVRQMGAMDMGVATRLGPFAPFLLGWVVMMAAMMLPATAPAVVARARRGGRLRTVPLFVGSYLAVWALVGVAGYAVYRPHGVVVAGLVVIAAGVYETTPLKRHFRRRCRESVHSGAAYGLHCVGSCGGLMAALAAIGVMSVGWMAVVTVVVLAQKLLPARVVVDVPLGLAIVGLGIAVVATPMSVPGLMPSM